MGAMKRTVINFLKNCGMLNDPQSDTTQYEKSFLEAINKLPPKLEERPRITEITEENLLPYIPKETEFQNIYYLNLTSNELYQISGLEILPNLKILVLSFNNITKIENIESLKKLERLELAYNQLQRIENLYTLHNLRILELNNNYLSKLEELCLLESNQQLEEISLKCNPMASSKNYRSQILNYLPGMKIIDKIGVNETDREALKNINSIITKEIIFEHAKFTDQTTETLLLSEKYNNPTHTTSFTVSGVDGGKGKKGIITESPNLGLSHKSPTPAGEWESRVETLVLNHLKVHQMGNMECLLNLRRLSLVDNRISLIQGLENCPLLEELSLEKNKISVIQGLNHLQYLKKLELGKNKIWELNNMKGLEAVTQLSLEDNEIRSLAGIESLRNLMEFYVGNNHISEIREVKHLKALPKLIILDISGNTLCNIKNERLYLIFNLKKLKVLDGVSIDQEELQSSKENFAGRLTEEILLQRLHGKAIKDITELDLSSCK